MPSSRDARVLLREPAVVAQDLERGARESVVQLARDQLVHRRVDARRPLAERVGELAERVELHRLDARSRDRRAAGGRADPRWPGGRCACACARGAAGCRTAAACAWSTPSMLRSWNSVAFATVQPSFSSPTRFSRGTLHVLEEDLVEAGVAGHLHERAHGDAGRLHVDQDVRDAAVLRRLGIGAHQAEHPVGVLRARGPDLLAVDDELVADELGAGAQRRQVGAGARLGVALAPDLVGGEDLRQVAPPLLLGAVRDQRRPDHLDAHHADEARRARAHHLLVDDRLPHDVGALAAVLARPAHGDVAGLVQLALPRLRA